MLLIWCIRILFQSTSPRGGRRIWSGMMPLVRLFQSTSPRGGRQFAPAIVICPPGFQSTSPRGGRRHGNCLFLCVSLISIHVPTRGTTGTFCPDSARIAISIHVPTRGTTTRLSSVEYTTTNFNPRPHAGDDLSGYRDIINHLIFQSTSPRGGRPFFLA